MAKKKLIVSLPGGVGNQLYAYFGGLYLSHKFGLRLVLDHSHANLNHHRRKFDTRIFSEIDNYSRSSIVVFILRSKLVNLVRLRFLAFLRSYGYWEKWKTIRAIITDFEDQKATLPQTKKVESLISELLTHKRVVRVSCYFPDFSYYNSLPKTLQSLNLKSTSTNFQEILKVKNGIGIHVRLGDLLQISLTYPGTEVPILTESYFISCLTAAKRVMGESPVNLFCDDYKSFLLLYPELSKYCKRITEVELHPAEELMLLSKMECIITSASSFSFWAARLSQASLIFVPDSLNPRGDTHQGFPEEWIRMPASFIKF